MKGLSRREGMNQLFGRRDCPKQQATLTRHHGGKARFDYEIRTAAGAVLKGCDDLGALMKHIEEKKDVQIVRTKDSKVIWPKEGSL